MGKNKKKGGRRRTFVSTNDYKYRGPQDLEPLLSPNDSSSNSIKNMAKASSGAFIDHREFEDLAQLHSSPARSRRRQTQANVYGSMLQNEGRKNNSSNSSVSKGQSRQASLPLTNQNLQSLLLQNRHYSPVTHPYGGVALDMNKYNDQNHYTGTEPWPNTFSQEMNEDSDSVNSMEFGGSNPSLHDSDGSTSLDDVCFPDYYDHEDLSGDKSGSQWPDLTVLEEFIKQEWDNCMESASENEEVVNFDLPNKKPRSGSISPKTKEEVPLLHNTQINEIDSLHLMNDSFRVRPTPIHPLDKSKDKIPTILNSSKGQKFLKHTKDGLCRFTYFREDLEKTIHSPTISGLLSIHNENKELNQSDGGSLNQPISLATIEELFMPKFYNSTPRRSIVSSGNSLHVTEPINAENGPFIKTQTPKSNDTPIPLTAVSSNVEPLPNPFWLDVLDPTEEEMKVLSKTFGIHPLTTEDIFLGEAREKVELFKSYYFVCFTSFDIVYERRKQRAKEYEKKVNKLQEMYGSDGNSVFGKADGIFKSILKLFRSSNKNKLSSSLLHKSSESSSMKSKGKKIRDGELLPLNMYMIVFRDAVITFHFSATPHPINVRRRARLLKDYLTVSSDWLCYALIDDITDSFAPMIDSIEDEVNAIEDEILKMHSGESDLDSDSEDEKDSDDNSSYRMQVHHKNAGTKNEPNPVFYRQRRSKSTVDQAMVGSLRNRATSIKSKSTSSSSTSSKILGWKRKGDMLRRIGECRKRVMSVLRLLGSKADVIKGFSKRFSDNGEANLSKSEIGMYVGDIQDHIVTMIQSLNHFEKLLARFHSNYLAQINIDMTKVNNDTNDVLGKITILGTIVLPINVVTGLWGMNCIVPGQDHPGLIWFWSIIAGMVIFSIFAYNYARRVTGL